MKFRNVLLFAIVLIVVTFALFNWAAIGTPLHVRYLLGAGELPLGMILLAMFAVMVFYHIVTVWFHDASRVMEKWLTARELNEALERATASDDDRISRLAKHIDEQHQDLGARLDELSHRLDAIKLAKVIERETADVQGRISKAEKGIRKDIRKSRRRRFRRQ